MKRPALPGRLVALVALAFATEARADFNGSLSLTGMLLTEKQDPGADASPMTLGHADLRTVLSGRRLAGGVEFKGDFRLRLTDDFNKADAVTGNYPITARGYSGGREYDLREAWVGKHGEHVDFAVGRLVVREADALRIDGLRLWWRFSPAWHVSLFGGLYPNPFARSLPDNYSASSALAGAAGLNVAYNHARIWGAASAVGTFFGGPSDGGPIDPALLEVKSSTEPARVYLTWTNYIRLTAWLDVFHDVVVDVAGSAGAQLTRLDAFASLHVGRLSVALGYDHLSSLAVEMYLLRLLSDRRNYLPGTIENNLIVERTARDEGRLRADVSPIGKLRIFGEARVRRRALAEPAEDPSYAMLPASLTAWDLTVGARSSGDLAGLRLGAAFTEITDFRAETRLVTVDAGRDFAAGRASLDASFIWEGINDAGAGTTAPCPVAPAPMVPIAAMLSPGCYGRKTGSVYQAGVTLSALPSSRWLLLGDYRLVISTSDAPVSAILTHIALLRIEVRW